MYGYWDIFEGFFRTHFFSVKLMHHLKLAGFFRSLYKLLSDSYFGLFHPSAAHYFYKISYCSVTFKFLALYSTTTKYRPVHRFVSNDDYSLHRFGVWLLCQVYKTISSKDHPHHSPSHPLRLPRRLCKYRYCTRVFSPFMPRIWPVQTHIKRTTQICACVGGLEPSAESSFTAGMLACPVGGPGAGSAEERRGRILVAMFFLLIGQLGLLQYCYWDTA